MRSAWLRQRFAIATARLTKSSILISIGVRILMGVRREVIGVAIARTGTWIRQLLQKTFRHTNTLKIKYKVAKIFLRTVRRKNPWIFLHKGDLVSKASSFRNNILSSYWNYIGTSKELPWNFIVRKKALIRNSFDINDSILNKTCSYCWLIGTSLSLHWNFQGNSQELHCYFVGTFNWVCNVV